MSKTSDGNVETSSTTNVYTCRYYVSGFEPGPFFIFDRKHDKNVSGISFRSSNEAEFFINTLLENAKNT